MVSIDSMQLKLEIKWQVHGLINSLLDFTESISEYVQGDLKPQVRNIVHTIQ